MMWLAGLLLAGIAYPDASPWGHAGVPGTSDCTACHWDDEAQTASPRLTLEGLPHHFEPGARYRLTIRLAEAREVNGFQLAASAGELSAADHTTRAGPEGVRSTRPAGAWDIIWIAGDQTDPVTFWLAVNDANGDGSEFGDMILLRTFEVLP